MTEKYRVQKWPSEGLETVPNCPVCGGDKRRVLHENLVDKVFFCAPGKWSLFHCESCASAFLDPRPTPETIGLAYETYFTHDSGGPGNIIERLKIKLRNGYLNYRYGTKLYPASNIGIILATLMKNRREFFDLAIRHLPKLETSKRLLDLGCGNGDYLFIARSAGWDVVGVDADSKAVSVASEKGIDVRLGNIEILDPSKEQFDVITLSHVIEHVHQPIKVLQACYKLLKPGGFLWIETRNIQSEGYRIFNRDWRGLEPPRHLVLFNFKSLTDALIEIGFSGIELQPYRQQCKHIFKSSKNIMGSETSTRHQIKAIFSLPSNLVRKSEKIAKRSPSKREFVTLKAWKE